MTLVFYARSYDRFVEIQGNLSRNNVIEWIKTTIFFQVVLAIEIMLVSQSNSKKKDNPSIWKDHFSSWRDPTILTSIALLLDRSNKISWFFPALKSTSHFLPYYTVFCRSNSSSEANYSCFQGSDAWSK